MDQQIQHEQNYSSPPTQVVTKKNQNMLVIVLFVILILILGVGGFFWYSISDQQGEQILSVEERVGSLKDEMAAIEEYVMKMEKTQEEIESMLSGLEKDLDDLKNPPQVDENGVSIVPPRDNDYIRGNPDAKLSLIVYSDIDCPFCARFHDTAKQVMEEYPDEINWVYRHFPLTQLHPNAETKAQATECVGELGGNDLFWTYLDKLFTDKTSVDDLAVAAAEVGVDKNAFEECLESDKYLDKIDDLKKEANLAGARGTPYSILYTKDKNLPIPGALPFDSVKQSIESMLD